MKTTVKQLEDRVGILKQILDKAGSDIWVIISRCERRVIMTNDFGDFYSDIFGKLIPFMADNETNIDEDVRSINESLSLTMSFSYEFRKASLKEYYSIILQKNKNLLEKLQNGTGEEI